MATTAPVAALHVAPRPVVDVVGAAVLAREMWGVEPRCGEEGVRELGSNQDRNFRIDTAAGPCVLKIANRGWGKSALAAQDAALQHIARANTARHAFLAPQPVPAPDGQLMKEACVGGDMLCVRMLTFVEGEPLTGTGYLAPAVISGLGHLSGMAASLLSGFEHAGLNQGGQWDLRQAGVVVDSLLASVADADRRAAVSYAAGLAAAQLDRVASSLRVQAIHGDVTDDNVVGKRDDAGRLMPHGIIDFGDLGVGWVAAECAITCASVLRHRPDEPMAVMHAVRAFHAACPLTEVEVVALWPLIVLRACVLVVSGEHQTSLDPDNRSATGAVESEWLIFRVATSIPFDVAEATIRAGLGLPASRAHDQALTAITNAAPLFPTLALSPITLAVVDLSAMSDDLHSGKHLRGVEEEVRLLQAAAAGATSRTAATRWGEPRLTRTQLDSPDPPATVAVGVTLVVPPGTAVAAPWPVMVTAITTTRASGADVAGGPPSPTSTAAAPTDMLVRLRGPGGLACELVGVVCGLAVGTHVPVGDSVGAVGTAGMVTITLCVHADAARPSAARHASDDAPLPLLVQPSMAAGWLRICPDPSSLLGKGVTLAAPGDDAAVWLACRDATFAKVQEHYYADPMRVERGWLAHLVDWHGRSYLDMVNNVAAIGHGHPRLCDAVHAQMRRLNTNSRFHYAAVAQLSTRLAALAPEGLDSVFLVNSGSEAVDLALRMAQVVTGRMDVVAVREAYHGVTLLSDAVTTSLWDNPVALETRPSWVHLVSAPNSYRGKYRGEGAAAEYIHEIRGVVEDMVASATPPAAYIAEPLFGNAGGIQLPAGYLAGAYEAVRGAGGLCIADEVQVGYGRTGRYWWAHEMHGVVPDMITIAKAMGNGYPLGAVITKRSIAEAFGKHGSFFSSAGGSPVACVVGLTVLDVIRDEGLQHNAVVVGERLASRCHALMGKYPIIGAVHGMGLYMGLELVRDRDSREPATREAHAICDRMRELGVIVQPTGERANVLKMKPPMCMTLASADYFVDQLERTLKEGW